MTHEASAQVPEAQAQELSSDMVKGAGATVLTIGAAAFVNYGISFVLDYADRRVDDPLVAVPVLGSMILMAVGKRMMDFTGQRRMLSGAGSSGNSEHDSTTTRGSTLYELTVFNDGSVMDLRPTDRSLNPQDPRNL